MRVEMNNPCALQILVIWSENGLNELELFEGGTWI